MKQRLMGMLSIAMLLAQGCAYNKLHPTYGKVNRRMFAYQASERTTREGVPVRGDQMKRIIRAYIESVGATEGGAAAGGGGPAPAPLGSSGGGAGANPFAFKVR